MKKLTKSFFFILFFLFLNFVSADEINRGLEIALKADNSFSGYGDSKTNLKMLLKDRKGSITERVMKMNLLEVPEDGDKSLIVFESPQRCTRGSGIKPCPQDWF